MIHHAAYAQKSSPNKTKCKTKPNKPKPTKQTQKQQIKKPRKPCDKFS